MGCFIKGTSKAFFKKYFVLNYKNGMCKEKSGTSIYKGFSVGYILGTIIFQASRTNSEMT